MLISNNCYRLGPMMGTGTRPRIDDGRLGIVIVGPPARGLRKLVPRRLWSEWTAHEFEVGSAAPVPAGIDGEAATLDPPLRFRSVPGLLRVRIASHHPGDSKPHHQAISSVSADHPFRSVFRLPSAKLVPHQ